MQDAHRADIKNGKDKKQGFSVEVELMWQKGIIWKSAAKTLMNTMYFHNGNIFWFRAAAHRIIQEHKILYLAMNLFSIYTIPLNLIKADCEEKCYSYKSYL